MFSVLCRMLEERPRGSLVTLTQKIPVFLLKRELAGPLQKTHAVCWGEAASPGLQSSFSPVVRPWTGRVASLGPSPQPQSTDGKQYLA